MPNENIQTSSRLKGYSTLITAFIAVVALLTYFLPRETKYGYEYEQGRPWRYAPLIAVFDFPIYKTQSEVENERDSALQQCQPFFTENVQVAKRQVMAFRKDFINGKYGNLPTNYLLHIEKLLDEVYQKGVVDVGILSRMAQERTTGIRIIEGNEAISRPFGEVFSTRSAYEYIMSADTVNFPRELLTRCNINEYVEVNLSIDSAKTKAAREDAIASVSPALGMVQSGQRIIDRGEIVSAEQYKILQSFERETIRRGDTSENQWLVVVGQALFITCILACFIVYLALYRCDYLQSPHSIMLLSALIAFFPLITYLMVGHKYFNVYIIPYAMIAVFVRIFMDSRTAFTALVTSLLISSLAVHSNYEFILVQLVAGMTAIYSLKDLTERAQLMRVALFVTLSSMFVMLGYDFSQGIDFAHLDVSMYYYILAGGVMLLFAYPLLYLIEKIFGFTSSVTLIELSNTNNPILRRMSKIAQGTFAHSLQVSNLAAEVADKIGAKPQLVRTGALYHDIGKILNPAFFTENQTGVNPHDELTEERSAQIIISHVTEGLRLADKYHLPKVIRDFIRTHHGCSQTKYFYIQWQNKHPNEKPDPKLFTYPGVNPFTREQAILMMCDAVEASSRSLKEYSEQNIKELVERIINGQVEAGFFRECPITFRDISEAKRVLVESLKTVYHTRIAYPELNNNKPKNPIQPHRNYFFGRKKEEARRRK